jgi:hypothetical protein
MASNIVVDGVLIPEGTEDPKAYAAKVRADSRRFMDAYWKLEEQAVALGFASLEEAVHAVEAGVLDTTVEEAGGR